MHVPVKQESLDPPNLDLCLALYTDSHLEESKRQERMLCAHFLVYIQRPAECFQHRLDLAVSEITSRSNRQIFLVSEIYIYTLYSVLTLRLAFIIFGFELFSFN